MIINPLNAELILICHLLALSGAHHILHVSRVRVTCDIYQNVRQPPSQTLVLRKMPTQNLFHFVQDYEVIISQVNWEKFLYLIHR